MNGLLGIGGGILLIPLLIYIGRVDIHLATGMTAAQGVVSGATGAVVHGRRTPIDVPVGLVIGATGIVVAATTALFSERIPSLVLTLFYLVMVAGALVLVLLPRRKEDEQREQLRGLGRWFWCVVIGVVGGVFTGLVGAGAGFVAVPLMLRLLAMPLRVVIGTSLVIILIASGAAAVGKGLTGQVPAAGHAGRDGRQPGRRSRRIAAQPAHQSPAAALAAGRGAGPHPGACALGHRAAALDVAGAATTARRVTLSTCPG